jgi:arylsulfatase A-like enzyme
MQRRDFLKTVAAGSTLAALPESAAAQPTKKRWNIVVVMSDTLRTAFLGPYGNQWTKTPALDRLAKESALFERAHPECLPTIPTRRTIHSGRRGFPFRDYQPIPWDNVYLPGWQPMPVNQETVAEALAWDGYHCGFISDVPHYFVPGNNFTRGFHQWDFVRGNAEDRFRSPAAIDKKLVQARYVSGRAAQHVANLGGFDHDEMAFATPRTFRSAIQFLDENQHNAQPFYLFVDTFHPHESWEAPAAYYKLYGDPKYQGKTHLQLAYSTLHQNQQSEAVLADVKAHYSGLVTMVDHWLGKLLDKLTALGKDKETLLIFVSDHGTNFGDNLEKATGKPAACLYPGTMDIPLLIRHPRGQGAGKRFRELVYTLDVPATVCAAAGTTPREGVDGKDLLPLLDGKPFQAREYLTCRYSNCVWYTDDKSWYFANIHGENARLFDLEATEPFARTIAAQAPERIRLARRRLLEDAGGKLPAYPLKDTDKVKAPFI